MIRPQAGLVLTWHSILLVRCGALAERDHTSPRQWPRWRASRHGSSCDLFQCLSSAGRINLSCSAIPPPLLSRRSVAVANHSQAAFASAPVETRVQQSEVPLLPTSPKTGESGCLCERSSQPAGAFAHLESRDSDREPGPFVSVSDCRGLRRSLTPQDGPVVTFWALRLSGCWKDKGGRHEEGSATSSSAATTTQPLPLSAGGGALYKETANDDATASFWGVLHQLPHSGLRRRR